MIEHIILLLFLIKFIIIALVSALEWTRYTLVSCDYELVTVSFRVAFLNTHQVVYLQRYLVVVWLVTRQAAVVWAHVLCTPYYHAPVCSATSCKATYVGCMCV